MSKAMQKGIGLVLLGLILLAGVDSAKAIAINLGTVDLSALASTNPSLTSATLVKWRTGTANQAPISATAMTFQYLTTGTGLSLPTRTTVKDFTANDQNDMWSDNGVAVEYVKGNSLSTQILIYTQDPSGGLTSSNGLVLPLFWKAVSTTTCAAASAANVNGSVAVPADNALYMATQVTGETGGACPQEGPYAASTRTRNGWCDYSTHYMVGLQGTGWYTNLTGTARTNAFNYASLVGPAGVNTTEQGAGTGRFNPAIAVLGASFTNASPTSYSGTIVVNLRTL